MTLHCIDKPLIEILSDINLKSEFSIFIHDSTSLKHILIKSECKAYEIEPLLNHLLQGTGLKYLRYDYHLFVVADSSLLNTDSFTNFFIKKSRLDETLSSDGVIIGQSDSINRSGQTLLRGLVIDGKTDSPIIGAYIKILHSEQQTVSELDGSFVLKLPVGAYTLEVEAANYHSYQSKLKIYNDGYLMIKMYSNSIELPEVVIGASAQSRLENAVAGVAELSVKEIKKLPALLGENDVIKALLTLPGVNSTGEAGSGFNVRGGNIDQNLIQQDGIFFLNPSHVLGLFSAFNPEVIKQVTFYKGHVPAQFGGRTSSVLEIKLKDPSYTKYNFSGGIGPIASKFFIEGPLIQNKTSFFMGGRFTYSDWILNLMRDPNLKNSSANFNDFNLKFSHKLNESAQIQMSGYHSRDHFQYSDQFGYGWASNSISLIYQNVLNNHTILQSHLMYSENKNEFLDGTSSVQNKLENGIDYIKAKLNLSTDRFENQGINLGMEVTRYLTRPEKFSAGSGSQSISSSIQQSKGEEYALYINDEIKLSPSLSASIGMRQSFFRNFGPEEVHFYSDNESRLPANIISSKKYAANSTVKTYLNPEPRLGLALKLSNQSSIKWSFNRLAQYIHLISNTAAATPVDIWALSNTHIKPQMSTNYSVGFYQNIKESEWETSVEFFYRKSTNIIEYKDFARLLRNEMLETAIFGVEGKAYGAEFFLKRNKNNPSGYISYTLSRSFRKTQNRYADEIINNGRWYASNFDKPHNLNAVINFQLKKTMLLACNFVYNSGRPLTAPVADFYLGDNGVFLDYSERNQFRIPDYHRLDISYTLTRGAVRSNKNKGSLTFSVYNLYSRRNAFSVYYKRNPSQPLVAYKLAVLGTAIPSITYNFQF